MLWLRSGLKCASSDDPELFLADEILQSMLRSKRRIEFIRIGAFFNDSMKLKVNEKLIKVLKHFGKNVKHVEFYGVQFHRDVAELLNLLPNLEKLTLDYLKDDQIESSEGLELKLPKLKEIVSAHCSRQVLEVFNALPPGVLETLEIAGQFRSELPELPLKLEIFQNQHNLKVLVIGDYLENINLTRMKLNFFDLQSHLEFPRNIEGQDEIWYFKTFGIYDPGLLKFICDEMKSLQHLDLGTVNNQLCDEISELSSLKKLKKLKIQLSCCEKMFNESLTTFTSSSLTDLDLTCYFELAPFAVSQLGKNCPNLNKVKFGSPSKLNVVNDVIESFQNLKELVFSFKDKDHCHGNNEEEQEDVDRYNYQEGLKHAELTKLEIFGWSNEYRDLAKLLGCCKNLKEFATTLPVDAQLLQNILVAQKKLKRLDLQHLYICGCDDTPSNHKVSREFVSALKEFGTNLKFFCCRLKELENEITEESLQLDFGEKFSFVEVKQKQKSIKWCMRNV